MIKASVGIALSLTLVVAAWTHRALAQDFGDFTGPCTAPDSESEKILLLHDISDLGDVPKSDHGIIHDELISAKNYMRCFQQVKKVDVDRFQRQKADFKDKVDSIIKTSSTCDATSSLRVKDAVSNLLPAVPAWAQPAASPSSDALRSLLQQPPQELCKTFRTTGAALVKTHDDEVDQNLKIANDRFASAQDIAKAYGNRYQTLKELSGAWSENTFQRVVAVFVILAVVAFAGGIFWVAARLFGHDLTKELIESGQLIQFPTVMILLVVITVLGLSHVIEDKTLGTLLGAVAGYVLAQGVGKAASREAIKDLMAGRRIGSDASGSGGPGS